MTGGRLSDQHRMLIAAVEDPETCLIYRPATRNYLIPIINNHTLSGSAPSWGPGGHLLYAVVAPINYCPWSGRLLPGELDHARDRVAKAEFGIPRRFSIFDDEIVELFPIELLEGEDWWINRQINIRRRPELNKRNWKPVENPSVHFRDLFDREPPPGMWRPPDDQAPPHLCEAMYSMYNDVRCPISYIPWTREYGIRRLPVDRMMETQPIRMRKIDFCPFCGTKLPSSLKAEWQRRIAEAGYDPNDENLPGDFLSDRWWKNAGL